MIEKEVFELIQNLTIESEGEILLALIEELGEVSRAIRVEDKSPMCKNKTINESSRVEIIDLILVAIELFVRRGGTLEEAKEISKRKLEKWKNLLI